MKLIRNTTEDGRCKYALVRLDKIRSMSEALHPEATQRRKIEEHLTALEVHGVLEYGEKGSEEEFFVIKLKDVLVNAPKNAATIATLTKSLEEARNENSDLKNALDYALPVLRHAEREWVNIQVQGTNQLHSTSEAVKRALSTLGGAKKGEKEP